MNESDWDSLTALSVYINKWAATTFPTRKPKAALSKLVMEEIPELLKHLKEHGSEGIGEELADCFILLLDLGKIWNVNLAEAIRSKMIRNLDRQWTEDELGHFSHIRPPKIAIDYSGVDQRLKDSEQFSKGLKT